VNIRFRGWRLALSLFSGLALALAFPNYNLPLLGWVSLAGLLFASLGAGVGHAALCGFLYGAVFYTVSLSWVYTVLRQYGPLPLWQAAGVMGLLVAAASLFCALFAVAVAWMAGRSTRLTLLAAPFLWVALELGRSRLPDIGFPWNLLGYTAAGNLALVQIAAVTGIYGLSLLVAAYNALLVWTLCAPSSGARRRATAFWLASTAALAAVALLGGRLVPQAQSTHVAHLVQTNLPQALDYPANWDALHAEDMAELEAISISAGRIRTGSSAEDQPGLIIWPEVPAPFSLQQPGFAQRVARIAQAAHTNFLFGEVDWKPAAGGRPTPYNSAALLGPSGREEFLYDKIYLVPFSEYVPWRDFLWFAGDLTGLIGDFGFGMHYAVGELPGGRFSVVICYEAVFPDHVRQFVRNGAGLLINISNDGWFGHTSAPAQHLAQARVRAVENRRWLLRDTNNGFTVSVDPYGRVVARLAPYIRGRLDAPYGFREDRTLFTRWGDWVAWLSVVLSVCLLIAALRYRPKISALRTP